MMGRGNTARNRRRAGRELSRKAEELDARFEDVLTRMRGACSEDERSALWREFHEVMAELDALGMRPRIEPGESPEGGFESVL